MTGTVAQARPTRNRVEYVVANLRQRDREELYALRWDNDPEALVSDILGYAGDMSVCWEVDHTPVALQGTVPVRPGVWVNWCFGTDDWPLVLLSMTRHAKRFIMPALARANFHRAEAHAMATHEDSRRWIEALGGRYESVQAGAGRAGEDFVTYVWGPDDVRRRRVE